MFLALLALAHAPLLHWALHSAPSLIGDSAGSALGSTLIYTAGLSVVAVVAWLAYERFATGARVTVFPQRWTDVGWRPVLVFLVAEAAHTALVFSGDPAELRELARINLSNYIEDGQLLVGWLIAAKLSAALAEELVYRAMLLRALEGYTADPRTALVLHAVVFELAHVYGYGLPFSGGIWFGYALIYGYAFQTSRSVAVSTLMHVGHNLLFIALLWWLAG